jgi:hypothetical protein
VDFADGLAGLGIGGGGYRARVQDNDICGWEIYRGGAAAIEELAFQGGAVGLRGAAAELLDVEGGHRAYRAHSKKDLQRVRGDPRVHREEEPKNSLWLNRRYVNSE